MSKDEIYKTGDVFKLPLDGKGTYGFGRILIKQSPVLLIGFYSVVSKKPIDFVTLLNKEYIIKMICGDVGFKKNEWLILGNAPLERNEELPLFWGKDALTDNLYLRIQ
jgi:hypothetical protein